MPALPTDIFTHIIEFIDDLKDLLSLAYTSRDLFALIVPQHSDYRRIVCAASALHVWEYLLDTPKACSYIRYLNATSAHKFQFQIPRLCPSNQDYAAHRNLYVNYGRPQPLFKDEDGIFLEALSKMVNLKVLAFETAGQGQAPIAAISEAIEKAGCELEEIEMHFKFINPDEENFENPDPLYEGELFTQYFEKNKYPVNRKGFSLLYNHLPSLQKYLIHADSSPQSNVFLQMLLNAPNLTHININEVNLAVLLFCHWPNLQHLVVYTCDTLEDNFSERDYTPEIRAFFTRHSKLITLKADYILVPGWALESDTFLPNIRSLGITSSVFNSPIITSYIGARLTHLDMNDELCRYLNHNGIVLGNLESCRYWFADPLESAKDLINLVNIIPNIQKLHIGLGYYIYKAENGLITIDEIIKCVAPFRGLKSLRILVGPFDRICMDDQSLLNFLKSMPGLMYTQVQDTHHWHCPHETLLVRLERDDITGMVRCEPMKSIPDECNIQSWGGFYRRGIHKPDVFPMSILLGFLQWG